MPALTGGWQQIDKLVRKNVLVKTRRPKATCFELSLPLVLFLLLVYVRTEYNKTVETLGPFYFEPTVLFPVSARVLTEVGVAGEDGGDTNISVEIRSDIPDEWKDYACDMTSSVRHWIEDAMEPILDYDVENRTIAEHIMEANASEVAEWVHDSIKEVQNWSIPEIIDSINDTRRDYLDSSLARDIERLADEIDRELDALEDDLNAADSERRARDRAEKVINDTCYLQGPIAGGNRTRLAEMLADLSTLLDESGIRKWVNYNGSNSTGKGPKILEPVRWVLNTTSVDWNEALLDLETLINDWRVVESGNFAEWVDQGIWWTSHFLKSNGSTAELIGAHDLGWSWSSSKKTHGTPPQPHDYSFHTELGKSVYSEHWRWQQEANVSLPEWEDYFKSVNRSLLDHIQEFMNKFEKKDAATIEREVLPQWESDWRSECLAVSSTKLSDVFVRTQEGCPFYRRAVKRSHRTVRETVDKLHKDLESMNLTKLQEMLEEWRTEVREVNASEWAKEAEEVIEEVQREASHRNGSNATKVAQELAHRFEEEAHHIFLDEGETCEKRRRLQDNDDDDSWSDASTYLQDYIETRKILVAPYKGEAKELWDLIIVEAVISAATIDKRFNSQRLVRELLRCPLVRAIASKAVDYFLKDRILTFESEGALETYARENPDNVLVGFVFRSANQDGNFAQPLDVEYSIRLHAQLMPSTDRIITRGGDSMFGGVTITRYPYLDIGFSYFQEWVGRAVARLQAKRDAAREMKSTVVDHNVEAHARTDPIRQISVSMEQFPAPAYRVDEFVYLIQFTLPMVMVLGWIYAVSLLVKEIVYEKQEHLREVMRIMGLRTWVYWSAWFGSAMAQMTLLVLVITLCMTFGEVLKHSNCLLVFAFFELYSAAVVSLAMLISACFSRAKVAAACAGVVYYLFFLPYNIYPRFEDTLTFGGRVMFSLLAPSGMGIGMGMVAKWELEQEGLQFGNLFLSPPVTNSGAPPKDDFSVGHVMVMFLVDSIIYQVIAWYIEKVWPGSLGLPQPWYFPILPSYWRSFKPVMEKIPEVEDPAAAEATEKSENEKLECWEAAPQGLTLSVHIHKLTKTFRAGKKALKGITLNMHEGTILGLLGHNGAGKSTTMSILTGLFPPTSGDVLVNGFSIRKDAQGVRRQLGVCLQHNALYETLTVAEHLELFCNLKGVARSEVSEHVDVLLQDIGLTAKRNAPSASLSGGMKRKLSIGIALAGGSRVIALDEPTAGVDAISRREIWQTLARCKGNRTILLSTHFMDEADVLSDRIAIIAEGQLTAIGTSMALKSHFADAYMLTVVTSDNASSKTILDLIQQTIPQAQFAGSRGREFGYTLPASARTHFADLFATMQDDTTRAKCGIQTYGLSAATMEEVFLHASSVHEEGLKGQIRNAGNNKMDDSKNTDSKAQQQADNFMLDKATIVKAPLLRESTFASTAASSGGNDAAEESPEALAGVVPCGIPGARVQTPSSSGDTRPEVSERASELASTGSASIEECSSRSASDTHSESETLTIPGVPETCEPVHTIPPAAKEDASETFSKASTAASNDAVKQLPGMPPVLPCKAEAQNKEDDFEDGDNTQLLWGLPLWLQQFHALLAKRGLAARRDVRAWASQIILPASFVVLALLLAYLNQVEEAEPPLKLTTDMYLGQASGSRSNLEAHIMPFVEPSVGVDRVAENFGDAWESALGGGDELRRIGASSNPGSNHSTHDVMTDYLMNSHRAFAYESYGALSVGPSSECECNNDSGISSWMPGTWNPLTNVTLWFKNRALHGVPAMVHRANNARLKMLGYDNVHIATWSHPLPKTGNVLEEALTGDGSVFTSFMVAITIILAMGFIPASFVVYLVNERANNGKHQQLLTGISPVLYWVSTYVWDIFNFGIAALVCFALFTVMRVDAYAGANTPAILALLMLYGVCMTPFMYCFESFFKVPATAYVTMICINIFTGTVSVLTTTILDMYEDSIEDLKVWNDITKNIFPVILPNYCLGRGLMNLALNYYVRYVNDEFGICAEGISGNCTDGPFQWDIIGKYLFWLAVMSGVWFVLRLLFEWRFFSRMFCSRGNKKAALAAAEQDANESYDEAVALEAARVSDSVPSKSKVSKKNGEVQVLDDQKDTLLIKNLRMTFTLTRGCCLRRRKDHVHSVRGINVGVARGECFGLLGVNGAGKTTTMRMITGDIDPCVGDVWLQGWSITHNRDKARKHLGYCPQFDALPDKLTVREVLTFYSRVRGVPPKDVKDTVETMISRMCLEAHQHRLCEHLSGGNKRKLSTAMSLLGSPEVVLLDEPSTGIDVGARRFLWDVLGDIRKSGHALILTSHSMDECEVLCTRLTIMVAGAFRCLGSPLQLKDRYGGGYTLAIKARQAQGGHDASAKDEKAATDRIRDFMSSELAKARLAEENVGLFRYRLGGGKQVQQQQQQDDVPLSEVFRRLEGAMAAGGSLEGCISDYTLSQTSLEEVFLFFSQIARDIDSETKDGEIMLSGKPELGNNDAIEVVDVESEGMA